MSEVKIVSDDNFDTEVLQSERPVLVDFWAPWCGPCKMIGPVIDELSKDYVGRASVCKVNIDENPEATNRWGIRSIPTCMVFVDGKMIEVVNGMVGKAYLSEMIDSALTGK